MAFRFTQLGLAHLRLQPDVLKPGRTIIGSLGRHSMATRFIGTDSRDGQKRSKSENTGSSMRGPNAKCPFCKKAMSSR